MNKTAFSALADCSDCRYNSIVSTLYIVGTPIGNLDDITFRALETFRNADAIACEDTRHTLQLLTHFDIHKPLISCRAQNERTAAQKIIGMLSEGKTIAYASDAGTPGISDPGAVLAGLVRKAGYTVVPVPGASAFTALASVAGAGGKTLVFEGFLSPKAGRRRSRLRELLAGGDAVILYESPFRIVKLLTDIADIDNNRTVVIGRELTKLHEEIIEGTAAELRDNFAGRTSIKGEFAVFISGLKKLQIDEEQSDN